MPNSLADMFAPLPQTGPVPQPRPSAFDQALLQYPILKSANVAHVETPMPGDNRMLEFWPPGETGDEQYKRPGELPMGRPGVQVISPDTKASDIAADVVSHYLVNSDPRLTSGYKRFVDSFNTPAGQARLHEDYKWDYENSGERRPFDQWAQIDRIPAYFRGYAFKQWPEKSYGGMYTPEQRNIMDDLVRAITGGGQR